MSGSGKGIKLREKRGHVQVVWIWKRAQLAFKPLKLYRTTDSCRTYSSFVEKRQLCRKSRFRCTCLTNNSYLSLFLGQITLRSTSPFDYPSINPKYFQDESDLKTLIEGVKTAHSLSKTLPLKSFGSTLIEYPDCANFTRYSDSYWECMIRFYTQTIYHFSGKY